MAIDFTADIVEVMEEARSYLFRDDAVLVLEDGARGALLSLSRGWSLIRPQEADQDTTPWVLRIAPKPSVTQAIMDAFSFVSVAGKRYEREWRNPIQQISSVWIAHVKLIGGRA